MDEQPIPQDMIERCAKATWWHPNQDELLQVEAVLLAAGWPELRARVAELEAALNRIADDQRVYKGHGDYDIIPALDADEAQLVARAALAQSCARRRSGESGK